MNKLFVHIEKQRIIDWLDSMEIKNYTINKDFTVDVNGEVNLYDKNLLEIPIQFGVVTGWFSVSNNKELKSLEFAPKECMDFYCNGCTSLKSLVGAPEKCENFSCFGCKSLNVLVGSPEKCQRFSCYDCGTKFTKKDVLAVCKTVEIFI